MTMMFVKLILAIVCLGFGSYVLSTGAHGGTLLMGIAALVFGAAMVLSAARTGGGGKHR